MWMDGGKVKIQGICLYSKKNNNKRTVQYFVSASKNSLGKLKK